MHKNEIVEHTHMHVHTDIQYIPSVWTPGNCLPASSGLCGSGNSVKHCAGLRAPEPKWHAGGARVYSGWNRRKLGGVSSGQLVHFYSHKWAFRRLKSPRRTERMMKSLPDVTLVGEVNANILQSPMLLWNVEFDEEFIPSSDCWDSLHSPNMEVVKVC